MGLFNFNKKKERYDNKALNVVSDRASLDVTNQASYTYNTSTFQGWFGDIWTPTTNVNEQTSRSISAVHRCVELIAGAISVMQINFFERTELGVAIPIDHDYWPLLNLDPHPNYTASVLKEATVSDMLLNGDGFMKIIRPNKFSQKIEAIEWAKSTNTLVYKNSETANLFYGIPNQIDNSLEYFTSSDVLHIPGAGFNGMRGISAIQYALKTQIKTANTINNHILSFYLNGTKPEYVIQFPNNITLKDEDIANIKKQLEENHSGTEKINKPLILKYGATITPVALSQADAQLIESQNFLVEDIARFFGVPSHFLNLQSTSNWGSSIEVLGIGFVTYTLLPIITKIEQELNRKLFGTNSKIYCKFDFSVFERADYKTMIDGLKLLTSRAGERPIISVNEARKKLGMLPVEGGDDMTPLMSTQTMQNN